MARAGGGCASGSWARAPARADGCGRGAVGGAGRAAAAQPLEQQLPRSRLPPAARRGRPPGGCTRRRRGIVSPGCRARPGRPGGRGEARGVQGYRVRGRARQWLPRQRRDARGAARPRLRRRLRPAQPCEHHRRLPALRRRDPHLRARRCRRPRAPARERDPARTARARRHGHGVQHGRRRGAARADRGAQGRASARR